MDWIDELKKSEAETLARSRVDAELKLRSHQLLQGKAPETWEGLVDRLKLDCSRLDGRCNFTQQSEDQITLKGSGSPYRQSSIRFMVVPHYIRIVRVYSYDGIQEQSDGSVEKIRMELQGNDSIGFVSGQERFWLVSELSAYLIKQVLQGAQPSAYERPY